MKVIEDKEDVKILVDVFYENVREDKILGPIFNDHIGELWFLHLDTLSRFWETLLLGNRTYFGAPFPKHKGLPIKTEYFAMWLNIFKNTVDDLFIGEKAEEAKQRAELLAKSYASKWDKIETNI